MLSRSVGINQQVISRDARVRNPKVRKIPIKRSVAIKNGHTRILIGFLPLIGYSIS